MCLVKTYEAINATSTHMAPMNREDDQTAWIAAVDMADQ